MKTVRGWYQEGEVMWADTGQQPTVPPESLPLTVKLNKVNVNGQARCCVPWQLQTATGTFLKWTVWLVYCISDNYMCWMNESVISTARCSLNTCFMMSVWTLVSLHLTSVCVLLWTARQHASHSLYMVTMWGANKVLRAALIWPSRQSQYPEVTTTILEGLLEGSPSHIIDCSKWTIWRRQNTYTHIFSEKASRWLWAVWAC